MVVHGRDERDTKKKQRVQQRGLNVTIVYTGIDIDHEYHDFI